MSTMCMRSRRQKAVSSSSQKETWDLRASRSIGYASFRAVIDTVSAKGSVCVETRPRAGPLRLRASLMNGAEDVREIRVLKLLAIADAEMKIRFACAPVVPGGT